MTWLISEWTYPMTFTKHRQLVWTPREDQRLYNSYRKVSKEITLILFPDRNWHSIKTRAYKLKISKKRLTWTKEENRILFKNYKKIPQKELMRHLPGRTWWAIRARANIMKIPAKGRNFTPEEDSLILTLYEETNWTYDQMSEYFINRDGCALRVRMYNIRKRQKEAEKHESNIQISPPQTPLVGTVGNSKEPT